MKPTDLVTLREIAGIAGVSLLTVRTWVHRSIAFPAPWRKGGPGDSDLYLRADIEAWLAATGRRTQAPLSDQ